jgi:hypothetical protein
MIRSTLRQIGTLTVATWVWHHRGSALRVVDMGMRAPQMVRDNQVQEALIEARAIVALDGPLPTDTTIRISGVDAGTVTLRDDLDPSTLDLASQTLLKISDVLDVRTDGTGHAAVDDAIGAGATS